MGRTLLLSLWLLLILLGLLGSYRAEVTISKLQIISNIAFRFSTTQVTARLDNPNNEASETTFKVTLPNTAFMSNFSMDIDGKIIRGEVNEKDSAKKQFEKAKDQGQNAGHVSATSRDSNTFSVAINVAAGKSVVFDLIYQEVLQRRLGHYEHVINLDPGQVVPGMNVLVNIAESRPVTKLKIPPIRKDGKATYGSNILTQNPEVTITRNGTNSAKIEYYPSVATQRNMSSNGIAGQLVVIYDVKRGLDAGDIHVINGYFVHALAPQGLPPIPKNILFILDVSGSMLGRKIQQVKDAMNTILDDVRHYDTFNLLTFSSRVQFWKQAMLNVNDSTMAEAKGFVSRMKASGGTAINDALLRGIIFLKRQQRESLDKERPSIIIFLTDGKPTVGQTNPELILQNVYKSYEGVFPVFALGFGNGVDFNLLKRLSVQNNGLARKIYEASDATLQLENFYQEVSIPLMSDVNITYETNGTVNSLTKHRFKTYFSGGEMIIAGKIKPHSLSKVRWIRPCFTGTIARGRTIRICPPRPWPPVIRPTPSPWKPEVGLGAYIERMWAYLTIKDLLQKQERSQNATEKAELKTKALNLSLQFGFVTPLTSMVVTLPENPTQNIGGLYPTGTTKPTLSAPKKPGGAPGRPSFFWGFRTRRIVRMNFRTRESAKETVRRRRKPTTTVSPIKPAPVVIGDPSMVFHLQNGILCLSWPRMAFSSHILFKQQGIEVKVSHGRQATVESVVITKSDFVSIVTPSFILINANLKTWTDQYNSTILTIHSSEVKLDILNGLELTVYKINDLSLQLEFNNISGIDSENGNGMLKNITSWMFNGNELSASGRTFLTKSTTVETITCNSVENKDIFDVSNSRRRA